MPEEKTTVKKEDLGEGFDRDSGQQHGFVVPKKKAVILEFEDVLFHHNSAVLLPSAPRGPSSTEGLDVQPQEEQREISGLAVIRAAYLYAGRNPGKRLIAAGHTDRSGPEYYNFQLSELRAKSVLHILLGERDPWVSLVLEKNKVEDIQQILKHVYVRYDWPCDPGTIDNIYGSQTRAAVRGFQETYNEEFDQSISTNGVMGRQTWGAVFDVYMRELSERLAEDGEETLDDWQSKITFLDPGKKLVPCGESVPIDSPGMDGLRSQTNRRVELVFFDAEDPPQINCPPSGTEVHPLTRCPIYNRRWVKREYINPNVPVVVPVNVDLMPAVILYPFLATPLVLAGNNDTHMEILLLTRPGDRITYRQVNHQLKIVRGLDRNKSFHKGPLFDTNARSAFEIAGATFAEDIPVRCDRITLLFDKNAVQFYRGKGYSNILRVKFPIPADYIREQGIHNLIWLYDENEEALRARLSTSKEDTSASEQFNQEENGVLIPREVQDGMMKEVLEEMNGTNIPRTGTYCFHMGQHDVTPGHVDPQNPIQSYHPVFYFSSLNYANFGHMADIHVCARQNLLEKSRARVIEYREQQESEAADGSGDTADASGAGTGGDPSPYVGSLVNVSSRNLKRLLWQFGSDPDIDIILMPGDLIDYIKSLYSEWVRETPSIKRIWDEVALGDDYAERYQDFMDYISFFSLLVDFYANHPTPKPVYILSGNHDCYYNPYGISPRVLLKLHRANAGLPADHNLTIYEACLIFGETYHELTSTNLFHAEKFKWFYNVLTPLSDFSIKLPNQCLVGLAWGDDEDVLDVPFIDQGQELHVGHLPRADNVVSNAQLQVVRDALGSGKNVILTSHFTFVSYLESIAMSNSDEGDVEFDDYWNPGDYDMGTFETNRKYLYETCLANERNIQCIVTGHSHRRGLYTINRADYFGDNSVKTSYYDFGGWNAIPADRRVPAVIVSDSAGSIPRSNRDGEFKGWGSDIAGGSGISFASNGSIQSLRKISAYDRQANPNCKPRIVVALDYIDILVTRCWILDYNVITEFETDSFSKEEEVEGTLAGYAFKIWLNDDGIQDLYIERVTMYCRRPGRAEWLEVPLQYDRGTNRWWIRGRNHMMAFRYMTRLGSERCKFLSMKFGTTNSVYRDQYDFDSPWNFEIQPRIYHAAPIIGIFMDSARYAVERDKDFAEIPDFDWRKTLVKYQ